MLDAVLFILFPAIVIFAGVIDFLSMKIPNEASISLVILFVAVAAIAPLDASYFFANIGAGALMLAVGVGMFAAGWIGGGDAKLMAAIALWFGFSNLLEFIFLTALSGAVLALALLAFRSFQMPRSKYVPAWLIQLHCVKGVPYGLALASSALALYPHTEWFSLYGR